MPAHKTWNNKRLFLCSSIEGSEIYNLVMYIIKWKRQLVSCSFHFKHSIKPCLIDKRKLCCSWYHQTNFNFLISYHVSVILYSHFLLLLPSYTYMYVYFTFYVGRTILYRQRRLTWFIALKNLLDVFIFHIRMIYGSIKYTRLMSKKAHIEGCRRITIQIWFLN